MIFPSSSSSSTFIGSSTSYSSRSSLGSSSGSSSGSFLGCNPRITWGKLALYRQRINGNLKLLNLSISLLTILHMLFPNMLPLISNILNFLRQVFAYFSESCNSTLGGLQLFFVPSCCIYTSTRYVVYRLIPSHNFFLFTTTYINVIMQTQIFTPKLFQLMNETVHLSFKEVHRLNKILLLLSARLDFKTLITRSWLSIAS